MHSFFGESLHFELTRAPRAKNRSRNQLARQNAEIQEQMTRSLHQDDVMRNRIRPVAASDEASQLEHREAPFEPPHCDGVAAMIDALFEMRDAVHRSALRQLIECQIEFEHIHSR